MFWVKWAVIPCEVSAHYMWNAKAFLQLVKIFLTTPWYIMCCTLV